MTGTPIRRLAPLSALFLSFVLFAAPSRAEVLFTFGEMTRLQTPPSEAAERPLSEEELALQQAFELYAYTVFEALQVANEVAARISQEPLFCGPPASSASGRRATSRASPTGSPPS